MEAGDHSDNENNDFFNPEEEVGIEEGKKVSN